MITILLIMLTVILITVWRKIRSRKGRGISILVPFRCDDEHNQRAKNWRWLKKYWEVQLPGAEIIMGEDHESARCPELPFSKSAAVNDAASKATGDIFVIVDADGYISTDSVLYCAEKIRKARKKHHKLWFVPYKYFFRLTEEASSRVLKSCPEDPYTFPTPPDCKDVLDTSGSHLGHWFGALIQIMPREAFEECGGWDPRFRGWGGEDHAAMRAMDTLYWPHKTVPVQVLHLWHPMFSPDGTKEWVHWKYRVWANQSTSGANDRLSGRYYGCNGHRHRMRKLLDEGLGRLG